MVEIIFENLEKECKECAEEFIEELELLPIFLNYYPDVQEKWLEDIGLSKENIQEIKKVIDTYAQEKVKLENERNPQKREEVIKIEDEILKKMFEARLLKIKNTDSPVKTAKTVVQGLFPNTTIIDSEQLRELENLTYFKEHQKRFPMNFLIFDSKNMKIISVEIIEDKED